ncbi:MAG: YicC/YloC family endoribonuclease [Flavobacteriaceae bacterium]
MIYSMTGYGKVVLELNAKTVRIEIKSLNSKSLDLNVRMPNDYRPKELELRKIIGSRLKRGKIDVSFYVDIEKAKNPTKINTSIVKNYMDQLSNISGGGRNLDLLKMAIKMPDSVSAEKEEIDEQEWSLIISGAEDALNKIENYRKDEGKALYSDFSNRLNNIKSLLKKAVEIDPERIKKVRERLTKSVLELKEKIDQNRFEQELIYYIEKLDINEEKIRLDNHLDYFFKTLNQNQSNGKKLGFIAQEIGREINTIGSKANYAPMQKIVVQMKDELEKIKEQLLNVL